MNPFFETWNTPFGTPPFDRILPEHFRPAYERAFAQHRDEIARIAHDAAPATFENVIVALEKSGGLLKRVDGVFHNLAGADSNDALQEIELELAPLQARHWNEIFLNNELFRRIEAVYQKRAALKLDAEALRVLERYHLDFLRAGAKLEGQSREEFAAIGEKLAELGTQFSQNVLADEQEFILPLKEADLDGLPDFAKAAAAETAKERGIDAPFAVTTARSSAEPFLQFSSRRDLREKVFKAWTARGNNGNGRDNNGLIARIVGLRSREAELLGYRNFAEYKLDDTMAKTPQAARDLLELVWKPARARALEERDALQKLISDEGGNFRLAAWDWRYYSEKLRKARYDFDETELKPYLQLESMIEAAFYAASRLFGLTFRPRSDIPVYHPDVRVWEIERGGAWMSSFRDQDKLDAPQMPLIVNVCNFQRGNPSLLSFDDARTLFHEFGHALHGLLSDVRFPRLSGTNVARDFVEMPSQIFEHWLEEPEILSRFARHAETSAPIPQALMEKLEAARNFNQGFATVEFLASAFVDMDFHTLPVGASVDAAALERKTLEALAMPEEIAIRHSSPHFLHVFGGDGYSAGYYGYMWSEVLDADGFGAFKEKGNAFDRETAAKLHDFIYSVGGTRDYAQSYRDFRGRDPDITALLAGRGLTA